MSKGLEAFYDLLSPIGMTKEGIEKFNLIEKELKVLEILKKALPRIIFIGDDRLADNEDYEYVKCSKEEIMLIKEWINK